MSDIKIVTIEEEAEPSSSVLRRATEVVRFPLGEELKKIIYRMEKQLYKLGGVGLAAPQIGINKKIAVIYIPKEAAMVREKATVVEMHVIINASYEAIGAEVVDDFEGCYSVVTKSGTVPRYEKIRVSYQDKNGVKQTKEAHGFYARVLQHEIDHLNGILIIDRLKD